MPAGGRPSSLFFFSVADGELPLSHCVRLRRLLGPRSRSCWAARHALCHRPPPRELLGRLRPPVVRRAARSVSVARGGASARFRAASRHLLLPGGMRGVACLRHLRRPCRARRAAAPGMGVGRVPALFPLLGLGQPLRLPARRGEALPGLARCARATLRAGAGCRGGAGLLFPARVSRGSHLRRLGFSLSLGGVFPSCPSWGDIRGLGCRGLSPRR